MTYRRTGCIGTCGVNRDIGLEPEETKCLLVSLGTSPMSRFTPEIPIHPVRRYFFVKHTYLTFQRDD